MDLLTRLTDTDALVLSPQSLNECYRALTERRRLLPPQEARAYIVNLKRFCTAPYDFDVTLLAWRIQDDHGFSFWDCVLLASALLAGCEIFFSENMQHARRLGRLSIIDPFKNAPGYGLPD